MNIADDLRDLFRVMAYDPVTQLFYADPGNLCFGVVAQPLSGADDAMRMKLASVLNMAFPTGTILQAHLFSSPDLESHLARYMGMRPNRHPLIRRLVRERVAFMRQSTRESVDEVSGLRVTDRKLLLCVSVPLGHPHPTDSDIEKVEKLREQFVQALKSTGIYFQRLDDASYLRFMQVLINPDCDASWRDETSTRAEDQTELCHQILERAIEVKPDHIQLGNTFCRTLHPRRYPARTRFGQALEYLGDLLTGDRGIRETSLVTCNIVYLDHEAEKVKREFAHASSKRSLQSKLAIFNPTIGKKNRSLKVFMDSVDEGNRIIQCYVGIAVFAPTEKALNEAATSAKTYWAGLGFQVLSDEYIVRTVFQQLLPFAALEGARRFIHRYQSCTTQHAMDLLPIFGTWRGTGTPWLNFISRDGQHMDLSPFDSSSNYNCIVAAESGAGKSFLINDLIISGRAMDAEVYVIDYGHSYRNTCELTGGFYMQFDRDTHLCLNPFSLVGDYEEDADLLSEMLIAMASADQRDPLDNVQTSMLKQALHQLWQKFGTSLTIDRIAGALSKSEDARARDVGTRLFVFTSDGEYGRYFNGPNNFAVDNPFIVCELEDLKGRRHLQRVVLLQLLYTLERKMYNGDRARKKLLIMDEAWAHLAQDDTRNFLVELYRRVRKFNGSAISITQSVNDLFASDGALAIVENSANMYLLRQKANAIDYLKKHERLSLNDGQYTLLKSLTTSAGQYSEIYAITDRGQGIGRLVVPEYSRLAYSTKPDDVARVRALVDTGMSVDKALEEIMGNKGDRNAA